MLTFMHKKTSVIKIYSHPLINAEVVAVGKLCRANLLQTTL